MRTEVSLPSFCFSVLVAHSLNYTEGNITFYKLIAIRWLAPIVCLFLWLSPVFSMGEVYQWTDPNGVIHFTDNFHLVPETVRNSSQLIIRKDFFAPRSLSEPLAPPEFSQPLSVGPKVLDTGNTSASVPVKASLTVIDAPQPSTTIVVVRSGSRRTMRLKKGKRSSRLHRHTRRSFSRRLGKARFTQYHRMSRAEPRE